jgi:hypothetical protein
MPSARSPSGLVLKGPAFYGTNNNVLKKRNRHNQNSRDRRRSKNSDRRVLGSVFYVIRLDRQESSTNQIAMSRPCNNCVEMLRNLGAHKVRYSDDEGNLIEEKVDQMPLLHVSYGTKVMRNL